MSLWKTRPDLATIKQANANTLIATLGIEITDIGEDFVRGTMPVHARTHQPYGILHGGASIALAETLGSYAAMLSCDPDLWAVGLDINANHVRAVANGIVTGTARPLHIGRSTQVWEIRIEDEGGNLVCIARLTVAIVPRQAIPTS
ncbi:MAG: hotdog fold thioesterase [Proteobacteria bacterium]|nr:hotdog fold thioesterase [Pseudomonadota bacterium]